MFKLQPPSELFETNRNMISIDITPLIEIGNDSSPRCHLAPRPHSLSDAGLHLHEPSCPHAPAKMSHIPGALSKRPTHQDYLPSGPKRLPLLHSTQETGWCVDHPQLRRRGARFATHDRQLP